MKQTTLDELEHLHAAATPGPWRQVYWDVFAEGDNPPVADFLKAKDAALAVALRNAAPALIAIARAALAEREATQLQDMDAAIPALEAAWEAMRVALDAWDKLEGVQE